MDDKLILILCIIFLPIFLLYTIYFLIKEPMRDEYGY